MSDSKTKKFTMESVIFHDTKPCYIPHEGECIYEPFVPFNTTVPLSEWKWPCIKGQKNLSKIE